MGNGSIGAITLNDTKSFRLTSGAAVNQKSFTQPLPVFVERGQR